MNKSKENIQAESLDRRHFLKTAGGVALGGAALGVPSLSVAEDRFKVKTNWSEKVLWNRVRRAFTLDKRSVYMNIGTTGSMPKQVLKNYDEYNELVAKDPWDMGGEWGSWPYLTDFINEIAPQFGADASEIVLSRNTTDGMCTVLGGLNLKAGDEILTTHHEHVAAISPLTVAQERYGVTVKELEIPVYPQSEDEFVDLFANNVSPNTRLIVFSHITYKTGVRLPAKRICQEVAIPNEIPTLIDGAHSIGMLDLDLHDIDCDFYAGSGHKWQCGPGATGILYVRDGLNRLTGWWEDRSPVFYAVNSSLHHYSSIFGWQSALQYIGNDNYPAKRALADACDMWNEIGRERIETRILQLSSLCKQLILEKFGANVRLFSPDIAELSSGLTAFNPFADLTDGNTLTIFRDRMREEYGYIIRTTDFHIRADDPKVYALRISTHLFHDERDVEGLVEAMWHLYEDMS